MIFLALFIGCIVAANWAIAQFGIVPVGFGLMAPAGVLFVGLTFTLRDLAQDRLGRWWVVGAVIVGAALSYLVSPVFALASGLTFLVSELADFLIYTPLREKHWLGAVAASNTVGLVVDSALFLLLAFGSLDFLAGQVVAKGYMTVVAIIVLAVLRGYLPFGMYPPGQRITRHADADDGQRAS
jgi:uncharacterized PurR-regulated membrane protein YhhQ (DUF165 family)